MRVAIVADSHFDETKRFAECQRLHAFIAEDAAERGVDLVLHAGDVFERKSTPLEREAAFGWFQRMADMAPVVVVRGNHDAIDDLPLLAKLEAAFPIVVVETAAVVEVAGALVACVAWPRKAALLAASGAEAHDAGEALAAEALRNVLRGLGDELCAHEGPTMVLMHAMVRDSRTSTGQPLVGAELEIGLGDLALARAGAYFLGHVHMGQAWRIGDAFCGYPGSPRRTAFGETEPKGYLIAEFDARHRATVQFIEAPATPMLLLEANWSEDWMQGLDRGLAQELGVKGAEVRFRYRVPSDQREAARASAAALRDRMLAEGAVLVKLDEVVMLEQRTRAEAIVSTAPLGQQVAAFWLAKGFDPGDRRGPLLAKVQGIEEAKEPGDVSAA